MTSANATKAKKARKVKKVKGFRESAAQTTAALLPDVPAGTILTHAAGATRITATLAGKEPLEIKNHIIRSMDDRDHPLEPNPTGGKAPVEAPSGKRNHIIPRATFDFPGGEARARISQREGEAGELVVEGEVMAFDLGCMGRAMGAVMRRISEAAALADAVLEMRVEREAGPMAACEVAVRDLIRELSEAGFPVRTGVLWAPAPGGDVWLGIGGVEDQSEALRAFIEENMAWRAL